MSKELFSPGDSDELVAIADQVVDTSDVKALFDLHRAIQSTLSRRQEIEIGTVPPSRVLLTLGDSPRKILAHRAGAEERDPNQKQIAQAAELLGSLIVCASKSPEITNRELTYDLGCTPGEQYISQLKPRGFKIAITAPGSKFEGVDTEIPGITAPEGLLLLSVEEWSETVFRNDRLVNKRLTQPISSLRTMGGDGVPLVSKGTYLSSPEDALKLYLRVAASRNADLAIKKESRLIAQDNDVQYVVLSGFSVASNTEVYILASARDVGSRAEKDKLIHTGRQQILPIMLDRLHYLPSYLQVPKLSASDQKKVQSVVHTIMEIGGGINNPQGYLSLLGELKKITAFARLTPAAQQYVISEWVNAIWIGTGNLGLPNKKNLGFCGLTVDTIVE